MGSDIPNSLSEMAHNGNSYGYFEMDLDPETQERLERRLPLLTPLQQQILTRRFGLLGEQPETLRSPPFRLLWV
jgi:DNA-directed RNA polymerase sigma subunit (sigma70/sigma32)